MTGNSEQITPVTAATGLCAYPSPFNLSSKHYLTLYYQGKTKLTKQNIIKIYNLKGQYLTQIQMPSSGKVNWNPPAELSSGWYLLRLISGNRILSSTSLQVIK
jgi:hypothetical protein